MTQQTPYTPTSGQTGSHGVRTRDHDDLRTRHFPVSDTYLGDTTDDYRRALTGAQDRPFGPMPLAYQPDGVRGRISTGVMIAALVVGSLGGVAGAAGYLAYDGRDGAVGTSPQPLTTSTISDRADSPARAGSVEAVAASVLPSVVKINVTGAQGQGSGSGVIISSDGEILTNEHVVDVASNGGSISVSFNDGSSARADVVGTDPLTDLAVIRARDVSGLQPATLGLSENLDVGEQVIAIGSPFGLQATVTSGIVSAINRPVSIASATDSALDTTYPAIQTDAAINPGNSGGPLVNTQGEVVGINSSIRTTSSALSEGGSIGLGFAIPIDKVLPIIEQLRNGETPTHARLGVSVANVQRADGLVSGAGIRSVGDGSAAARAGLDSGDVVTRVNDEVITGAEALVATIRGYRPGETVTLTVVSADGGDPRQVEVVLDSDEGLASS